MNIESNFIDGTQAKELNELCKEYPRLKAQLKEIKAEFERVEKRIKELCPDKLNETAQFTIQMTIVSEGTTLDTDRIKKEYPEIAAKCQKVKKGYTSIKEILKK